MHLIWSGSSAWLEYMPVTHGVAGSSPVQTAKNKIKPLIFNILGVLFFQIGITIGIKVNVLIYDLIFIFKVL